MTVAELIEALEAMPREAVAVVWAPTYETFREIEGPEDLGVGDCLQYGSDRVHRVNLG